MLCVPILADEPADAKRDAILAAEKGADIVEYRVDLLMEADLSLEARIGQIKDLVAESPLPCIVTCRPEWEGGLYAGGEDERVSMFEALGTAESPPAYIDVELKAYTASANIRQKINLAVDHPKQERHVRTRLILSSHDFQGRPADLTRKILAMQAEPACAVIKVAYRARSIRDNLELFDTLGERQKPTIALGMGEFGLMSRVLAPKFGGFLTFASLRDESATAPGQPTIDELLGMYRFRSIGKDTKVYGVIGWPVTQSMSPLIHNAGFAEIGWDGVYVPMPVEGSYESFKATISALACAQSLSFDGASITIPHKTHAVRLLEELIYHQRLSPAASDPENIVESLKAANTLSKIKRDSRGGEYDFVIHNTDATAVIGLVREAIAPKRISEIKVRIYGAGGVARASAFPLAANGAVLEIHNRSFVPAHNLYSEIAEFLVTTEHQAEIYIPDQDEPRIPCDLLINCTPVGMSGGPNPDGQSIPLPDLSIPSEAIFFDTVYNPIETPMLKAAKERGYRTIDGVQMFVRQAAAQFELWTGHGAPVELFDRLVRERLGRG
ncbi:MAG: type I 3-dehydroquinate dehydratase [Phycisphaerales bacterium]|nr:type I 3-dehydroquinate dehydratase [Phycisphaerales bacterium]